LSEERKEATVRIKATEMLVGDRIAGLHLITAVTHLQDQFAKRIRIVLDDGRQLVYRDGESVGIVRAEAPAEHFKEEL